MLSGRETARARIMFRPLKVRELDDSGTVGRK
jgi:hypothetical protein